MQQKMGPERFLHQEGRETIRSPQFSVTRGGQESARGGRPVWMPPQGGGSARRSKLGEGRVPSQSQQWVGGLRARGQSTQENERGRKVRRLAGAQEAPQGPRRAL